MSTRKSTNKATAVSESPVSTPSSTDSSLTRSTTTTTTRSSVAGSEPDAATDSGISADTKRPRRSNVRTPTTPSSSIKKKIDENHDEILPSTTSGTDVEDEKNLKSSSSSSLSSSIVTTEDTKQEDNKNRSASDSLNDSPIRAARKRKVFDKTAIVTRKSAMDLAQSTKRVLRCDRRNSTGKFEHLDNEPKKRSGKKAMSSTPEPLPASPISLKRKRENSIRSDDKDETKKAEKIMKLEPGEGEEQFLLHEVQKKHDDILVVDQKTIKVKDEADEEEIDDEEQQEDKLKRLVEDTDSKDDELVEVVEIKQEMDEDTEDVLADCEIISKESEEVKELVDDSEKITVKKVEDDIVDVKDEDKLSESEITIAKLFEKDSKKSSTVDGRDIVKKTCDSQKESKCIPETISQTLASSNIDKKVILKNEVKQDQNTNNEGGEKRRRGRPKKILTQQPTPIKKEIKKIDKSNIKDSSNSKSNKTGKNIQSKASTTTTTSISKSNETIRSDESAVNIEEKVVENKIITTTEALNGVEKPLIVDTNTTSASSSIIIAPERIPPGTSTDDKNSEKAASLSPELISEGISVISVKQFYKKPEFLENNLGIENDPKLGDIVQEVEKSKDSGSEETQIPCNSIVDLINEQLDDELIPLEERSSNCSGDSLRESERLILDDSTEEDGNLSTNKTENNDDNEDENDYGAAFASASISASEMKIKTENIFKAIKQSEEEEKETKLEQKVTEEDKEVEEETLSNNATIEVVDALENNTCDNNSRNTAVDKNEIADGSVCKSDTEIKDKIACNKSSREENVNDNDQLKIIVKEKPLEENKVEIIETEVSKMEIDLKTSSEEKKEIEAEIEFKRTETKIESEKKIEDNKEISMHVFMDVCSEDVSKVAAVPVVLESDVSINNLSEPDTESDGEELTIDLREDVSMDVDEVNENKENVSEAGDIIKDVKENLQNSVNTSMKIEKSDEQQTIEKREKRLLETPETLKQKENHLKNLGLLTHKAAVEAKIEKQRRRRLLQTAGGVNKKNGSNGNGINTGQSSSSSTISSDHIRSNGAGASNSATGGGSSGAGNCNKTSQEYTGTLKTVIKLNRQANNNNNNTNNNNGSNINDNKRSKAVAGGSNSNGGGEGGGAGGCGGGGGRQSLKMTFQKGRVKIGNSDKDQNQSTNSGDDTYYTIQNETEDATPQQETLTHGRKSHNRYHTTTENSNAGSSTSTQDNPEKKVEKEIIVIPEKASSFGIHPGRLCQDQCFYCGGKFGLFDTPCHVAQLKSSERQQKILANEEKLTIDNCLCDACFRHVDRRANAPQTYKKRLSAPGAMGSGGSITNSMLSAQSNSSTADESTQSTESANMRQKSTTCFVPGCNNIAEHPLRRRFIRKTIKKISPNFDLSTIGTTAPICSQHYDAIVKFLGCALCKRRLCKNNMYYINQYQESDKLEKLLEQQGIPVKLGKNTAVCKLCRYFTNLLLKPPDAGKISKKQFVKNYRKRLLHFYNIQAEDSSDCEEQADDKSENESNTKEEEQTQKKVERRGRKKKLCLPPTVDSAAESEKSSSRADTNTPQSSEDGQVSVSVATSGQMMLDNDVMVDYDVPVPISDSPSPPPPLLQAPSKLQTILQSGTATKDDISIVLRSNPNISMRELFPGEEEMGLQINVPFGSSSSVRTPEGWTRVNTFLQYDEPTRRLWEDLQKPYGNHSSFLRHLILLEKYFRNGDLILSQNASTNAIVYSETVQNRLRSYDNLNVPPTIRSHKTKAKTNSSVMDATSAERISKQFSNLPVTITAKPRSQPVASTSANSSNNSSSITMNPSSSNNNSILKSNLLSNNRSIEIVPIMSGNETGNDSFSNKTGNSNNGMTRQQRLIEAANRLINNSSSSHESGTSNNQNNNNSNNQAGNKKSNVGSCVTTSVPPELISINRNQATLMQVMKNKQIHIQPRPETTKSSSIPPNLIVLPDTLSPLERMQSKNWRPTLVPVSSVSPGAHLNASGPLYQTADGRRLPALVQVQSGGRPFLISIHDYNRMCILRREKLMREQMVKGVNKKGIDDSLNKTSNTSQQQQQHHQHQQSQIQQNRLQIPNKILEQNSLIPVSGGGGSVQSRLQQQLNSGDLRNKKLPQQSLLKSSIINCLLPIAPKPGPGHLQIIPPSIASHQQRTIVLSGHSNSPTTSTATSGSVSILSSLPGVLTLTPPTTSTSSTSWLWNNVTTDSNNPINGNLINKNINLSASCSSASSSNSSSPSAIKQQLQQNNLSASSILDNALLSKIPKSLTVIPQQKSQERTCGNTVEDLTSA